MRVLSLLAIGLAALPVVAHSGVYKWKDASGQVHYTQTPPPNGATSVQTSQNPQPGVSLQAPANAEAPAASKPAEPAVVVETKEAKAKRCTASKERVTFLEEHTARRLMLTQPDGSESRMTEEEFDRNVAKAREAGKGC